jgi:hypothetical protein
MATFAPISIITTPSGVGSQRALPEKTNTKMS